LQHALPLARADGCLEPLVHGVARLLVHGMQPGEQLAERRRVEAGVGVVDVDPAVDTDRLPGYVDREAPAGADDRLRRRHPGLPAGEVEGTAVLHVRGVRVVVPGLELLLDRPATPLGLETTYLAELAPRHRLAQAGGPTESERVGDLLGMHPASLPHP